MTRAELLTRLDALPACAESRAWAAGTPGTPEELWTTCPRGDWLLWLAASAGADKRLVVVVASACAEEATPYLTDSTRGPALAALETARRWARGEATEAEVRTAADAAAYAATPSSAIAAYAAADVAYAAADIADVAYAAYATDVAAYAVERAASAIAYTAYAAAPSSAITTHAAVCAAKAASLQRSADIVRARIPWATVEAALLGGAT